MLINLDPSLEPQELTPELISRSLSSLEYNFLGKVKQDQSLKWNDPNRRIPEFSIAATSLPENAIYHLNYIKYLEMCYDYHYVPVVAPDLFWNVILGELATHVKDNAEIYRETFSRSDEKVNIVIQNEDLQVISVQDLIDAVKPHVPENVDAFIPEFSESIEGSNFAAMANFLDMVSPYYSYSMLMCGFPRIDLRGTREDWKRLLSTIDAVTPMFSGISEYLNTVRGHIANIVEYFSNPSPNNMWQDMMIIENCGSGHQTEIFGWICDLFLTEIPSPSYSSNFPTNVAKIHYKQLNTGKEYDMYYGLFSSRLTDDGCLIPCYSYVVMEPNGKYETFVEKPSNGMVDFEIEQKVITTTSKKLKPRFTLEPWHAPKPKD